MRKFLFLLPALCLTLMLAGTAFATDPGGIRILSNELDALAIVPQDASGTAVERQVGSDGMGDYPGAVKLQVTLTGAETNAEYLLTAQVERGTPTETNLAYIDQKPAAGSSVTFTIYPSAATLDRTYYIYLSSNGTASAGVNERTLAATFQYIAGSGSDVALGDVTGDGEIATNDAVMVLQAVVNKRTLTPEQQAAADVVRNADGTVDIQTNDAVRILQYVVGRITSFE